MIWVYCFFSGLTVFFLAILDLWTNDGDDLLVGRSQITTYSHKDGNNRWFIKKFNKPAPSWNSSDPIELVRNGDLIRLEHRPTRRNLHSHKEPAPISRKHFQVGPNLT